MFMTLFLERMGALSATKSHVAPRLPKLMNVLPMYRYIFQGSNFHKQYALNTIFKLFRYKNFKIFLENQL